MPPGQRPRLHVGLTGAPGAGKSTLTERAGRPAPRRGRRRPRRGAGRRPVVAVLGRRHPRRPGPHERPRPRPRRCSSARWPPAATSAGWRWPRPRRSGCSTRSATAGCSSRRSASARSRWRSSGAADTTVVVVNPGWGDAVQANKAGLMEIADVFVINKADRPGRRRHPAGPRADARPVRGRRRGGRRSSPPTRSRATAWTSWSTRCSGTARTSSRPASSTARRDKRLRDELRVDRHAAAAPSRPTACSRKASATSSRPRWWPAASTRGPPPTRCWPGCQAA